MYYTSEEEILHTIDTYFPKEQRGDDCAVLEDTPHVISLDILSEHVDFHTHTFLPEEIGYKALAVNISDIFSMLAMPSAFLLGLTLPTQTPKHFLEAILHGMSSLANTYGISLIGGDISSGSVLSFACTILGTPIASTTFRGKSALGDAIFYISATTQPLGLARVGYQALEKQYPRTQFPHAIQAQCTPPLLSAEIIQLISQFSSDITLMDISDGLARDIPRILKASYPYGASITLQETDLHREVLEWCVLHKYNPIEYALLGGEEYCLLGTCPATVFPALVATIPNCIHLGNVTQCNGITLNGNIYTANGFDHFTRTTI